MEEYDRLDKAGKGALLRGEGLFSSLISSWRTARDHGAEQALARSVSRPKADLRDKRIDALDGVSPGKVAHLAGEARVANVDDMRKTGEAKWVMLLISLLHRQRVEARDEVVTMFCRRAHRVGTFGDHWSELVPVDRFRDAGARVPDEIGDGLDGYALVTHDGDEQVT